MNQCQSIHDAYATSFFADVYTVNLLHVDIATLPVESRLLYDCFVQDYRRECHTDEELVDLALAHAGVWGRAASNKVSVTRCKDDSVVVLSAIEMHFVKNQEITVDNACTFLYASRISFISFNTSAQPLHGMYRDLTLLVCTSFDRIVVHYA